MKKKIAFGWLTIIVSAILYILLCNYVSNVTIESHVSDVENFTASASTATQIEAIQTPIVIDFLKWYKKKVS
ncbi:hypothetical protein [Bacteroides hominis]|uniref:hypothetical protein n=1 Tax=Bacteroides hominis TaxID=2763023 RepID=UPI003D6C890D